MDGRSSHSGGAVIQEEHELGVRDEAEYEHPAGGGKEGEKRGEESRVSTTSQGHRLSFSSVHYLDNSGQQDAFQMIHHLIIH